MPKFEKKNEDIVTVGFFFSPSKAELAMLKDLDIYNLDIVASLKSGSVSRIIKRRKYFHIILSTPVRIGECVEKETFGIFIFPRKVIIVGNTPLDIRVKKWKSLGDTIIEILNWNLKRIKEFVEDLDKDYDELEEEISEIKRDIEIAIDLWDMRDDAATLLRIIKENMLVIQGLSKLEFLKEKEAILENMVYELKYYLEDTQSLIEDLKSAFDAYVSLISYDMGEKVENLTYITIALAIPQIIAGFYGMNLILPFQRNPMAFLFIALFSLLLSFSVYLLLRFRRNLSIFIRKRRKKE